MRSLSINIMRKSIRHRGNFCKRHREYVGEMLE